MRARTLTLLSVFLLAAGLAGCTSYDDGSYGGYGYGYDGRYGAGVSYGYPGPYYGFGAYRYSYGFPYIVHRKRHFDGYRHRHFRPHRAERHDHDGQARSDHDTRRDGTVPRRRDDGGRDFDRRRERGGTPQGPVRVERRDAEGPPARVERRAPERRDRDAVRDERRRAPPRQAAEPMNPDRGEAAWSERRAGRFDGRGVSPSRPGRDRRWQSDK